MPWDIIVPQLFDGGVCPLRCQGMYAVFIVTQRPDKKGETYRTRSDFVTVHCTSNIIVCVCLSFPLIVFTGFLHELWAGR